MGYSTAAIKGISWMTILRGFMRGITLLRTAILARIFTPAQFGIFGIISLVIALFEVFTETGINVFLIQEKKNLTEYVNEAWFLSIMRGIGMCILIIVASPILSSFFHAPQVFPLLLVASLLPLIRGFINPSEITFQKELVFKKEFYLRITLYVIETIVSVGLAFFTRNVVSLVIGLLISALFEVGISFLLIRPLPRLSFHREKILQIVKRGKWVTAFNIFGYLSGQVDNATVGKLLGVAPLGLYENAYNIATTPVTEISDLIVQVTFPVFSRIADDKARLLRGFLKSMIFISIPVAALGVFIFVFPKEIVLIILGNNWLDTIPVLRILVVYGTLRGIFGSTAGLFLSVGRQDLAAGMTMVRFFGLAISIIPLVMMFGLVGAGFSAIISECFEIPFVGYGLYRVFSVHTKKQK